MTISVDKELMLGLIRLLIVQTSVEIFFTPLPVTKYEIMKSSKDIVKAMSAPDTTPGMICGTMTFHIACVGLAPRSIAASARLGSSPRSFGMTLKITYGVQNAICASSMVKKPFSICRDT